MSRSAKPAKAAKSASASKKPKAAPVATTQNQAPAPIATFDAVPEAQAQAVAQRLKLIETLIVRYGRAYDYRALTLKDLEKLVAELEHGKSSGLAAVPTPATASAPAAAAAPATRVPADNAEADDSLATSQAAPADIGDAEKGLPEIPPPAYHDDAGNLAPDTAPAPPTAE